MTKLIDTGVITALAMLGGASGGLIEHQGVSIPTLVGIAGVVVPATWLLGKKYQLIEDRLERLEDLFKNLPCLLPSPYCSHKKDQKKNL